MSTVCVIGLGYIGLPTAAMLASRGHEVIGCDVNKRAVECINGGRAHFFEPDLQMLLSAAVQTGRLRAQVEPIEADYFILAVPTPFKDGGKPDMSFVEAATDMIAPVLRRGCTVILESTSPVGSTEALTRRLSERRPDLMFPRYQQSGEADVCVAHCPERVMPGQMVRELVSNDRIIGGMTDECCKSSVALYETFVSAQLFVTDCRTAEFVKLTENSYRDVNIAFANELSLICDELNVDVWRVIELANRHPRVNILRPGAGVGGHCIAVDPLFIIDSAPKTARLIRMAREVNDSKPVWVSEQILKHAARFREPVVACYGLAYKPDVDDLRESPAVGIVKRLAAAGGLRILVVEPNVQELPPSIACLDDVALVDAETARQKSDIVAFLVGHRPFHRMERKLFLNKVVVDAVGPHVMSLAAVTRQVTKRRIVQGVFIVSAALAVEYGAQLARSLVLTRTLSPTEFGIASSMAILASLVDMSTGLGADRYLVQAKDGGGREALAVAHALTVGKSALSACLLLALAWPTAALLGVPQATGAFLWLASIPMVRGFEHLRVEQVQRENRFWPSACAAIAANVAGLAAVAWAAFALRDHRAVLWGLGAQAAALVLTSRLLARAPYRLSVSGEAVRPALRFGLPLMVNGLALAALGQFDRLAVGGLLGVAELGRYSLATMIFYLPTSLLFRVVTSIAQPRLAAAWHASPLWRFPELFRQMNAAAAAGAALAAAGAAMFGDTVLTAVFGPAFGIGDPFFAVFGLAVFMRFAKQSANIAGLAIGRTKDLMLSNLPGALGLAATVAAVLAVPSLAVAAAGVLVGEALGAGTAFLRLDRDLRAAGPPSYAPFAFALPIPCAAGAWVLLDDPSLPVRAAVLGALCLCVAAAAWLAFRRRAVRAAG